MTATAPSLDEIAQAMRAVIGEYLRDACPCRFPRFRAVVSLDTSKTAGAELYTAERQQLVRAHEQEAPIVNKRPLPPWTQIEAQLWQGECGVCGSTVSRSANESGAIDYLVFKRARGLADVGAPVEDGKVLRASAFTPGGPSAQGAGKAAAMYPIVPLDELVRWLTARR